VSEKHPAWHSPEFYRDAHELAAKRVSFIEHKGRRILFVDFFEAELEVVKATAAECLHVMSQEPAHSVLSLVEVEGIPFHPDALKVGSELTEMGQAYSLRTALSGVSGFRSFMLQTIANATKRPIRLFKERVEALDWLVTDVDAE
jgi:hypothetical protein